MQLTCTVLHETTHGKYGIKTNFSEFFGLVKTDQTELLIG